MVIQYIPKKIKSLYFTPEINISYIKYNLIKKNMFKKKWFWNFPGGAIVKTAEAGFRSLVRELRSHMLSDMAKKKKKIVSAYLIVHNNPMM